MERKDEDIEIKAPCWETCDRRLTVGSFRIIGPRTSTSKLGTERINVSLRSPIGAHLFQGSVSQGLMSNVCRDLFNDKYTGKTKGGFVVYYVSPGKGKVTAFQPVGFVREMVMCACCSPPRRDFACLSAMPATVSAKTLNRRPASDAIRLRTSVAIMQHPYVQVLTLWSKLTTCTVPGCKVIDPPALSSRLSTNKHAGSIPRASLPRPALAASAPTSYILLAGMERISTVQTTSHTLRIPKTGQRCSLAAVLAVIVPRHTLSRFPKSCSRCAHRFCPCLDVFPRACADGEGRLCGTRQRSTTRPSGLRMGPNPLSSARVTILGMDSTATTCLVGRETRCRGAWMMRRIAWVRTVQV